MNRQPLSAGLTFAIVAAASFGVSGALIKPLLEGGWSPAAAVTVRALAGGLTLAPFAVLALRGRWGAVWTGRWRILGMAAVGVAGTQLFYFAAVQRIPVGTAILIEYMAPLLLVAVAWVMTRRRPALVVLVGSVAAFAGLMLIVSPSASGALDPLGIAAAVVAMACCAGYFVIAARPSAGLPPVVLASAGLLIAPVLLVLAGLLGAVPFTASIDEVALLGRSVPWWVPMLIVGVVSTAVAYATSITAGGILGSRLASFVGLLEVAAAGLWAWMLLGENLTMLQLLGGALILTGIGFVHSDRSGSLPDDRAQRAIATRRARTMSRTTSSGTVSSAVEPECVDRRPFDPPAPSVPGIP